MFPGMGNPKQMAGMLKQFGIKTEELDADRVIIECSGKKITIREPKVTVMLVQGQKIFTIMGTPEEENAASEGDVKLVMEQAGANKKQAEDALKKHSGDIAEAITELKKK
ncbi:MAG: nascent polypeptide-associated complex protein [Candidatus ainarchaeum sp.]|nr:nascent polypeptide-associated complex protein [Candidatus ainarchaeum sp.]